MENQYNYKLKAALAVAINYDEVIKNEKFLKLLKEISDGISCDIDMILWPILTICCSLMGISIAKTHRTEINFCEPNVLWTCVAAESGSRKTVALGILSRALKSLEKEVIEEEVIEEEEEEPSSGVNESVEVQSQQTTGWRLFNENESITMAKLHEELCGSGGKYLALFDEIEGFMETLNNQGRPDSKDKRMWLSLHSGSQWGRNTRSKRRNLTATRVSYTGYMQPDLMMDRLAKRDVEGLMDRHWISIVERRVIRFEMIGKDKPDGLLSLFRGIYWNHEQTSVDTPAEYRLTEEAGKIFATHFNNQEAKIKALQEKERQVKNLVSTLNKSAGNALRLSMVIQAIHNSLNATDDRQIDEESLGIAISLINYNNKVKEALSESMPKAAESVILSPDIGQFDQSPEEFCKDCERPLTRLLAYKERKQMSTDVLQNKRYDATKGKSIETAKAFMGKAATIGFGTIEGGLTKKSIFFIKHPFTELKGICREFVEKNKIEWE